MIGLVQVATQAIADRYAYIPSIGLSIVVAWGLSDLARRWPRGQTALAVAAAVAFLGFAAKARAQTSYWKDGVTLFSRDIQVVKGNTMGWRNLGVELSDRQRWAEALPMFRNVLAVYPRDAVSLYDMATAYERLDRLEIAVARYRESLEIDPRRAEAHYNLGTLLNRMGRTGESIAELEAAIRSRPGFPDAYNNLGNALSKADRDSEAIASYEQSIRMNPSYVEARNNLGTTYRKLGRADEALEQFSEALRINPRLRGGGVQHRHRVPGARRHRPGAQALHCGGAHPARPDRSIPPSMLEGVGPARPPGR